MINNAAICRKRDRDAALNAEIRRRVVEIRSKRKAARERLSREQGEGNEGYI